MEYTINSISYVTTEAVKYDMTSLENISIDEYNMNMGNYFS